MKNIVKLVLIMILTLSLVGCGVKDKLDEKVAEEFTEKIIESAGGGDVDIDGDTVVFKGEDGEEVIFGSTEWPSTDLAKNIPELNKGTIVAVMASNDSMFITLEDLSEKDFADYQDEIKKEFTEESYSVTAEDIISYGAANDKGINVTLTYSLDKTLSITVVKETE